MKKYVITGMIISLSLMTALTGCGKQAQAETNSTTVSETTTEAETTEATTISETTVADMGKYGEYGKEAYDLLKFNWENRIYEDETELRENAPIILGSISEENLESIIQELLSIDRPNSTSQETTQSESLTETKPVESTKVPEPTQAPQPEPTQAVEPETKQAEPQQTTPSPQPQVNNTPPAAIGQEEEDAIWEEAGLGGTPNVTISDGISLDPNAGEGYNWH